MMGIAYIPHRLCAICVRGEATTTTRIDGRVYQVCAEHGDPAEERQPYAAKRKHSPSPDAVIAAVAASPGINALVLTSRMLPRLAGDEQHAARGAFGNLLRRMVRLGKLRVEGEQRARRLWVAA